MSGGGGHGTKRRAHEEEHEEHENHERWLVSYADMMTLLMVLFIVLFAISQVNQKKFAQLKDGVAAGFGTPSEVLDGGPSLLSDGGGVAPDPGLEFEQPKTDAEEKQSDSIQPGKVAELASAQEKAAAKAEVEKLEKTQQEIAKSLEKAKLRNDVTFRFDERGLIITIASDDVLFESGSARLEPTGRRILDTVAPDIKALPNRISIEGHTNSIPISTAQFPSNWELSGDRASGVVRYLISKDGIPGNRLSAVGLADTVPLVPNRDPRSVVKNRRVEIVIVARADNATGRAVSELGKVT